MQIHVTMYQHVRAQQNLASLEQRLKVTEQPLPLTSQLPSANTITVYPQLAVWPLTSVVTNTLTTRKRGKAVSDSNRTPGTEVLPGIRPHFPQPPPIKLCCLQLCRHRFHCLLWQCSVASVSVTNVVTGTTVTGSASVAGVPPHSYNNTWVKPY